MRQPPRGAGNAEGRILAITNPFVVDGNCGEVALILEQQRIDVAGKAPVAVGQDGRNQNRMAVNVGGPADEVRIAAVNPAPRAAGENEPRLSRFRDGWARVRERER